MTAQWVAYTGSDEQIAEMKKANDGYLLRCNDGIDVPYNEYEYLHENHKEVVTHYLICNPHPLADMIIQQARTGQPVYVKVLRETWGMFKHTFIRHEEKHTIYVTATPNWNIPNAEYSFIPFED